MMKEKKIRLSIIIPIYNPPQTIFEKVLSYYTKYLLSDIELILVDDGSDEWVEECIKRYCVNENIYYIRQQNSGVSAARNTGIKKANGTFLCFADADDEFYMQEIIQFKNKIIDKESDLFLFDFIRKDLINSDFKRISLFDDDCSGPSTRLLKICCSSTLLNESFAKIYRKDLIEQFNLLFDTSMAQSEDSLFVFKYISHCKDFCYFHKVVYLYLWDRNTTLKRILSNPIARLDDTQKSFYEKCKLLQGCQELISDCTQVYVTELGKRVLLLINNNILTSELKKRLIRYYTSIEEIPINSPNKRFILYKILFKYRLWAGFCLLALLRRLKR